MLFLLYEEKKYMVKKSDTITAWGENLERDSAFSKMNLLFVLFLAVLAATLSFPPWMVLQQVLNDFSIDQEVPIPVLKDFII